MSEAHDAAKHDQPGRGPDAGPRPEPIRFFGTTWVNHDGGYWWRRAAVTVGSLAAAAAGAFVVRFAYQGVDTANVGSFVELLFIAALAICTALAFRRTWDGFVRRRTADDGADGTADGARSLMLIGFIGSLLAYFLRSLTEAPGEKLHRAEYERALAARRGRRGRR